MHLKSNRISSLGLLGNAEFPDLPKRTPIELKQRFDELVEWADLEGLEVALQSFAETRFDKDRLDDLSDHEKETILQHLRKLIVITRARREGIHD